MKTRVVFALMSVLAGALTACAPAQLTAEVEPSALNYQDMQAFNIWLKTQKGAEAPKAFKPAPMQVEGVGRVRATPEIAVIIGTITTNADKDDAAMNAAADIINAVQDAVDAQDVELNFTQVRTTAKRDDKCLAVNQDVMERHNRIVQDNQYNANITRQKEQGRDVKLSPKEPRDRLAARICSVTYIEASLTFTARVKPANEAGNIITAFTNAGVSTVDLYGYDFTDYDRLYQQAAIRAVKNAKDKAERVACKAGTDLTQIVSFQVDAPQRTARFGPQAMIISNHQNRNTAPGRYVGGGSQQFTVFNGVSQQVVQSTETIVTNTGEILCRVEIPAQYKTVTRNGRTERILVAPARDEWKPDFQAIESLRFSSGLPQREALPGQKYERRVVDGKVEWVEITPVNNALRMSLQAGQRTISVNARMSYLYETPIDGSIVPAKKL